MIRNLLIDLVVFGRHAVDMTATSVIFEKAACGCFTGLAQVVRLLGDLERRLECRAARRHHSGDFTP